MALPSTIDAFLVIALLIPGFITLTLFRWIAILEKELSQYRLVLWSLFSSLVIYAIFGWHAGISDIDSIRQGILIPENLLKILALSIAFGIGPGLLIRLAFRSNFVRGDSWEASMKEASEKGSWVTIYTEDDCEYIGYLHYSGGGDDPRDISIREPELILRDKDWNVTKKLKMGKEVFFLEKGIKRIIFHKEV